MSVCLDEVLVRGPLPLKYWTSSVRYCLTAQYWWENCLQRKRNPRSLFIHNHTNECRPCAFMLSKPPEHVAMQCITDQTVFIIILLRSINRAKRCCPLIPCLLVPVSDSQVVFQNCLRMHPCWLPLTTAPPHSQQLGCWLHTHTHTYTLQAYRFISHELQQYFAVK